MSRGSGLPRLPSCPPHLNPAAGAEWRRIAKVLQGMGVFTAIDRAALAAYCQAYGRWVEVEERLREAPLLYKTPSGYVQQSPLLGIVHKQLELMGRYMTELELTPASRSRVSRLDTPGSPCLQIEQVSIHALSDAELERIARARPDDRAEMVRHGG